MHARESPGSRTIFTTRFSRMEPTSAPQKHVFVCVNVREEGDCCSNVSGQEIFLRLKQFVLSHGMAARVRVTKTGCMGHCNDTGATVAIYPEGKVFKRVTMEDVEKIEQSL